MQVAPAYIWELYKDFKLEMTDLLNDVMKYGLVSDNDQNEFNKYILGLLNDIDEKYPLKDE